MDDFITGQYDNWISAVNMEEVEMVSNMFDHLLLRAKSHPKEFRIEVQLLDKRNIDWFFDSDEETTSNSDEFFKKARAMRAFSIRWDPARDCAEFNHIRNITIKYAPAVGHLGFNSTILNNINNPIQKGTREDFSAVYHLGFENSETIINLKKKFHRLNKMVTDFWRVEVPRQRQEDATNFICTLFPTIVDDLLLKELSDVEERDD